MVTRILRNDRRVAKLAELEVIAHCRGLIAGYEVPKPVVFVDSMPTMPTGNVKTRALAEQLITISSDRTYSEGCNTERQTRQDRHPASEHQIDGAQWRT